MNQVYQLLALLKDLIDALIDMKLQRDYLLSSADGQGRAFCELKPEERRRLAAQEWMDK